MKKILIPVLLLCISLNALCQKSETRKVQSFSGIHASGMFDITIVKGETESLVITADDRLMPYVRSEIYGNELNLFLDSKCSDRSAFPAKVLKAVVTMRNLTSVSLSGACRLQCAADFSPDAFDGGVSGASKLSFLNLHTKKLSVKISGASKVEMNATVSGVAEFKQSGSAMAKVALTAKTVGYEISGASKVEIIGSAESALFEAAGASSIKAGDFAVQNAEVRASGASGVTLHITGRMLEIHVSGAAKVWYSGTPQVLNTYTSSASAGDIRHIK